MKKKFLSTLIIGGILCSGNTLVFAKENSKSLSNKNITSKVAVKNINNSSKENLDDYTTKELSRSIEEMREADSILNNKDLTKLENYNRMLTFASTSLDRIRTLKDENLTEEMNTHIDFISSIGEEVRQACENSKELTEAIKVLEKTFLTDNCAKEEKEDALYKLNDIIVKNIKEDKLNKVTLAQASKILHTYANTFSHTEKDTSKEVKETPKESSYNIEQMNYAIEEMKEACRLLDNADLSKLSNYERMIRFGTASLDRARSLKLNENSELACHLEWIEESGNSVRNTTFILNNLITTIRNEKEVFASYSHSTLEEKKNALSKLESLVKKEESSNHLNETTIENTKKIIANCYDILKISSKEKVEYKNEDTIKNTVTTSTSTDTESHHNLNEAVSTGTETNISAGVDVGIQADINNTTSIGTEVNMEVGTDSSCQTDTNYITNNMFEESINSIKPNTSNVNNKTDIAIGDDTILHCTDVETVEKQEKTDVTTETQKPIHVSIGSESIYSIKPMTITKISKAPVSAIATQTDIPRVSAVATQTDIPRVSSVATQTDIAPVSAIATQTSATSNRNVEGIKTIDFTKNKEISNKASKDIKNNIKEKNNMDNNTQTKKNTKSNNSNAFNWLGLGLVSTLVCAILKKFI